MKITKLSQLDELIAKELGWIYYVESEDWYEVEGIMLPPSYGWVPPEYANCLLYYFNNLKNKERVPYYSTELEDNQKLVNYIHSIDYLELCTHSNKYNCCATVYQMDEDYLEIQKYWDSTCGEPYTNTAHFEIDSPINSVPLAICLAFLKYKSIEVELNLEETT